eukprot:990718-Alexandrium_andersonii.AAC.1
MLLQTWVGATTCPPDHLARVSRVDRNPALGGHGPSSSNWPKMPSAARNSELPDNADPGASGARP